MPIYDYRCEECGTVYDVFHKVREVVEDIVCPSCHSPRHVRLISAPQFSMGKSTEQAPPSCADGCCGGSCGMN